MVDCENRRDDGTCAEDGETCDECEETIESMGTVTVTCTTALNRVLLWCVSKMTEPSTMMFIRGVLGGIFISIGCLMSMLVKSDATLSQPMAALLSGLCFSVGLFLTFVCNGELFTGNCLTHVSCEIGLFNSADFLRAVTVPFFGNAAGVCLATMVVQFSNIGFGDAASAIVAAKNATGIMELIYRGVACNFLVCAATWISANADSIGGRLIAAAIPVTVFVALGFEHGVADMFYVCYAGANESSMLGTLGSSAAMLAAVSFGNIVGGAWLFSPLVTYSNN